MTEESILPKGYKFCECGCKTVITCLNNWGKPHNYVNGHQKRGKHHKSNGRYLDSGYWALYKPDYFSSDKKGRIHEHVFVYQEHHKCCMLPWGDIHHIDEKPSEENANRIENLQGMMKREHMRLHHPEIDMSDRRCSNPECKTPEKTYINKKGRPRWFPNKNKDGFLCHCCKMKENWAKRKLLLSENSSTFPLTDYF